MKRMLVAVLLCIAPNAFAFNLDLGGLGNVIGVDEKTMKRLEQGARIVGALIPISDAEERKLGRAVAERVIARYGIEHNQGRTYFLNLLGTTLARRSDRPGIAYRFAILATDDVNAYACPGGYIFVTRGALNMVRDEAELAAVLAHEISHVTERHIVKALQQSSLMKVGAEVAAEAFDKGGALFNQMADFATDALFNGLEKDDEFASDQKALVYLDRLGYDYPAMYDVLKLLDERRKAGQTKVLAKTHPSPTSRIRKLRGAQRMLKLDEATGIRLKSRFESHIKS